MSEYKKQIKSTSTGMICAEVIRRTTGNCCGQKFYMPPVLFDSSEKLEKRFKKAHAWVDETIKVLEAQEAQ